MSVLYTPNHPDCPKILCDFLGTSNNPLGGVALHGGSWNPQTEPGTPDHPGIVPIRSAATGVNSGGVWGIGANSILLGGSEHSEHILRPDLLSGCRSFIGFQDSFSEADPQDSACFYIDGSGVIYGQCGAAGTVTRTSALATLSTGAWYRLSIHVRADLSGVDFTVYDATGSVLGSGAVTTNLPTATGHETGWGCNTIQTASASGVVNLMSQDFCGLWIDRDVR